MPKRDKRLYLEDILDSAEAIKEFIKDLNFEDSRSVGAVPLCPPETFA